MSALGDVTDQRQHLALLVHGDAAVLLSHTVESADGGAFKGAPMAVTWAASSRSARTNWAQGGDRLIARARSSHRATLDTRLAVSIWVRDAPDVLTE